MKLLERVQRLVNTHILARQNKNNKSCAKSVWKQESPALMTKMHLGASQLRSLMVSTTRIDCSGSSCETLDEYKVFRWPWALF